MIASQAVFDVLSSHPRAVLCYRVRSVDVRAVRVAMTGVATVACLCLRARPWRDPRTRISARLLRGTSRLCRDSMHEELRPPRRLEPQRKPSGSTATDLRCRTIPTELAPSHASARWRNGSASDSRSDGWAFESLWPHFISYRSQGKAGSKKNMFLSESIIF